MLSDIILGGFASGHLSAGNIDRVGAEGDIGNGDGGAPDGLEDPEAVFAFLFEGEAVLSIDLGDALGYADESLRFLNAYLGQIEIRAAGEDLSALDHDLNGIAVLGGDGRGVGILTGHGYDGLTGDDGLAVFNVGAGNGDGNVAVDRAVVEKDAEVDAVSVVRADRRAPQYLDVGDDDLIVLGGNAGKIVQELYERIDAVLDIVIEGPMLLAPIGVLHGEGVGVVPDPHLVAVIVESGGPEPPPCVGQLYHFGGAAVMGHVLKIIGFKEGGAVCVCPDRGLYRGDHIAPRKGVRLICGEALFYKELLHFIHAYERVGDVRYRTDVLRGGLGIIAGILKIHPLIMHASVGKTVHVAAVSKLVVTVIVLIELVGSPFGSGAGDVDERENGIVRRLVFPTSCREVLADLIGHRRLECVFVRARRDGKGNGLRRGLGAVRVIMAGDRLIRCGEYGIELVVRSQLRVVRRRFLIRKDFRLLLGRQRFEGLLGLSAELEHVLDVFRVELLLGFMLGRVVHVHGTVAVIAVAGVGVIRLPEIEFVHRVGVNDLLILHFLQGIDLAEQRFDRSNGIVGIAAILS